MHEHTFRPKLAALLLCLPFFALIDLSPGRFHSPVPAGYLPLKSDSFPVPATANLLFYLQRSTNTNTVVYELNKNKAGKVDRKNPIRIAWISYAEGGQREQLTAVQRKFAYGLKYDKRDRDSWDFHFVSLPDKSFQLRKTAEGKYRVSTLIAQEQAQLRRVFLQVDGGSFLNPKVSYARLEGKGLESGKALEERINP